MNPWINRGCVGSKVYTKDARWLWIIAAEPDLLSLSRVPSGDSDILGARDIQKSEEIASQDMLCVNVFVGCLVCILVAVMYFY